LADLDRLNRDGAPQLEAEEARYGMRAIATRSLGKEQKYVRVSPFIMPTFSIVPGPPTAKFQATDQRAFRFWVPIDDSRTWLYILTMRDVPFSDEERAFGRSWVDADYRRLRNAGNNYMQDRQLQKTLIYSGIQCVIPAEQDACATESMGPIYDRTKEHLGYSDKTIIALRKFLLRALTMVQKGDDPPHVVRDPSVNDFHRLRAVKGIIPAAGSWLDLPDNDDAS
jgi:hypothetical protein